MGKGVIFDVDGVIVDVSQSYHYAIKYTAERFLKREVPLEEALKIKFTKGINNDWLATLEVIRELGGEARLEDVIEVFNHIYKSLREKERLLLDGNFFEKLKGFGYSLGVVTGRPREDLNYLFEKFGLYPYFDCIVDEDTIQEKELRKPHPYALNLCVSSLGIDKGVYVGDSLADWQMVKDYVELYKKPMAYIHVGEKIKPEGVIIVSPDNLLEALQEVLQSP